MRDRIPAGDVPVANKTGSWSNAVHDVAIIYAPTGAYLLVVLSDALNVGAIADLFPGGLLLLHQSHPLTHPTEAVFVRRGLPCPSSNRCTRREHRERGRVATD